jgi:hypothetical protein
MKKYFLTIGLAAAAASSVRADYNPIPLYPSSFNADAIIEAGAPRAVKCYTTATMAGGTNNNSFTFFETGWDPSCPWMGLPAHGSTYTSPFFPDHSFKMAPSYAAPNAILIGGVSAIHHATGTFTVSGTPAAYTSLSVLYAGGGSNLVNYTVHHASPGVDETGSFSTLDWLTAQVSQTNWLARGYVNQDSSQPGNQNSLTICKLLHTNLTLLDNVNPVTGIDFNHAGPVTVRSAIFALSGSTGGNYTPITVTGYNEDMIVEATPATTAACDYFLGTHTVTFDGGSNNTSTVVFEKGFNVANPTIGMPTHGTQITNATGEHTYQMPATYAGNCCLYLDRPDNIMTSGTLTLSNPTNCTALSVLGFSAGGASTVNWTVHHADSTTETGSFTGSTAVFDWFTANVGVWTNKGRFTTETLAFDSVGTTSAVKLYTNDIVVANTTSPVTSVDFTNVTGGRVAFFALSAQTNTGTFFWPVPFTGFNADCCVESTGWTFSQLNTTPHRAANIKDYVTVTMDGGTNKNGYTWYEQGYYPAFSFSGLPHPGAIINSLNDSTKHYQFAADYTVNNAIYVDNTHTNANLTIVPPYNPYSQISFLDSDANTTVTCRAILQFDDNVSTTNNFSGADWFGNANPAYIAYGRLSLDTRSFDTQGSILSPGNPRLYEQFFAVTHSGANLTNINLQYVSGTSTSSRIVILAVSGTVTPLPPTFTLQPTSVVTNDGSTVNFYGVAGANVPVTYQWQAGAPGSGGPYTNLSNGGQFSGVTTTNLQITGVAYPANYADYIVIATDSGGSVTSSVANLKMTSQVPPVFTLQPSSVVTNDGSSVNFVAIPTAASPFTLQWQAGAPGSGGPYTNLGNGGQFSGVTTSNLTITGVGYPTNYADYILVATVANAVATSSVANLKLTSQLPPTITLQPVSIKTNDGVTVKFSCIATSSIPVTFQWVAAAPGSGGPYTNLTDGGQFSGTATTNLVITSVVYPDNLADYRMIAATANASSTSSVANLALLTSLANVLQPTDPIVAYQPNGGNSPAAESVDHAIDGNTQKYLNFGQNNNGNGTGNGPYVGPTGFIVTPAIGSTIVTVMRLYTANDTVGRDPADYTLEGSNDGGTTWNPISSGALALPAARNAAPNGLNPYTETFQEVRFVNSAGYTMYRWYSTNDKDNTQNSMQIGEVELRGVQTPSAPIITLQPVATVTNYVGANPKFKVKVEGFPTNFTYQWYKAPSTAIAGATAAAYTKSNAQLADSGSGYYCAVTNSNGGVLSSTGTLYVIPAPTQAYPVAIMADNPLGYWRLDETPDNAAGNIGTVANDYWGANPGSYSNVVLGASGYNATADPDTATTFGSFLATDSLVTGINTIDFTSPSNTAVNFSVEAWVNGPAQSVDGGIITKGYGGSEQFNLDTGGKSGATDVHSFRFFVRDANNNTHNSANSTVFPDGNWHHIVGVCDESHSQVIIYVDGISNASATAVTPYDGVRVSTEPVTIGSRKSTATGHYDLQFAGTIDDAAIYPYALTPAQVLSHFYAGHYPPRITQGPTNVNAAEGTSATFTSTSYGSPTLTYQWYDVTAGDPGVAMAGKTTKNLVLPNVTAGMNGNLYRIVVSNPYGSVTNPVATDPGAQLTVVGGPPTVLVDIDPGTNLVYSGDPIVYAPQIGGTAPLTFQWFHNDVSMADGGRISGAHTSTLTIVNSQAGDSGTYYMSSFNAQGGPVFTSTNTVIVETIPDFNLDGTGWTFTNGTTPATIVGDVLTLTSGANSTTRSAWYNYPVYVGAFRASYVYQDVSGAGGADGTVFVLQNDPNGTAAIGGGGGLLGFSGITPSVGLCINIYFNNTVGYSFGLNGNHGVYTPATPVAFDSADPIRVDVTYWNGVLNATFTDLTTLGTYSTSVAQDLPTILGGTTAYVGFTAATGGAASTQTVSNFWYVPLQALSVAQTSPSTVQISWPAGSGRGWVLQSATNPNGPWTDVAGPPVSPYTVTITPGTPHQYFKQRLVLP